LKSKSWDTRIAAGNAIQHIASNANKWNPNLCSNTQPKPKGTKVSLCGGMLTASGIDVTEYMSSKLKFTDFDIVAVFKNGRLLLGSAGKVSLLLIDNFPLPNICVLTSLILRNTIWI
jgi:TATA-binding protein-associated factor